MKYETSRPAWARELKPDADIRAAVASASRPAWARELKLAKGRPLHPLCVAPRVGA